MDYENLNVEELGIAFIRSIIDHVLSYFFYYKFGFAHKKDNLLPLCAGVKNSIIVDTDHDMGVNVCMTFVAT